MSNCILKINKDHFFAFEEEMKNDMLFFSRERQSASFKCVPQVNNIQEFIP